MKFFLELRCCSLIFAIILAITSAIENSLRPEKCKPPSIFFDNGIVKHCAMRKNQYALRGETVKLPCGDSMRRAEPEWYKNGQRIDLSDRITQHDISKFLMIENLEFEDNGVYTCLERLFDEIYQVHSLNLEVQSLPYFTFTQENISVVKGQPVNLKCQVNGEPKPMVRWLRNNEELHGTRYELLQSGDLQIQSTLYNDGDEYTCVATNTHGSVDATTHIVVKNPTEISNVVGDRELIVGDTAKFRCNVVADPSLKLRIDWLKNQEAIDIESDSRIFLNTDGSLITIMKINELDAGTYSCVASTEIDNAKAQTNLTIHGWPKPPTLLGVDCGDKEIRISWNATSDDRWPITHYTIEHKTALTPDSWEVIEDHIPASDQTYTAQFIPWIYNTYRVIAWNHLGASQPSSHISSCPIKEYDVPYKNPDNVEVKEEREPFPHLKVKWSLMPPIEHGSFRFMYRVYYKRDTPGENWKVKDIDDWTKTEIEIKTDHSDQRYKVKVIASNFKGECKELPQEITSSSANNVSQEINGSVNEGAPLQAPGNFTLEEVVHDTMVWVSWTHVYDEAIKVDSLNYLIEIWTDANDKKTVRPFNMKGFYKKTAGIHKLLPRTKYYARIRAYDERGSSPPSEVITIDTSEEQKGPVTGFRVNAVGSTAMILEWSKPIPMTKNLWGYNITFQKMNESTVEQNMERYLPILDKQDTSARLLGLSPQTHYRITIWTVIRDGEGEPSSIQSMTRASKRPDKPTFTLHKIPKKNELLDLKVVRHVKEDDVLESYFFVEYKLLEEDKRKKTHLEKKINEIVIPSFKKGHTYLVYVIAVDAEYFVESDPQKITF